MDYYRWIDPFVEIERANQLAAYAREQGRNDVLDYEHHQPGRLHAAIQEQAYRLAERVVQDQIRPTMNDALVRHRYRDAALELLSLTPMKHILGAIEEKVLSSPVYSVDKNHFGVVTRVQMRPFEYAVMERFK